jgi:hypothetical protein
MKRAKRTMPNSKKLIVERITEVYGQYFQEALPARLDRPIVAFLGKGSNNCVVKLQNNIVMRLATIEIDNQHQIDAALNLMRLDIRERAFEEILNSQIRAIGPSVLRVEEPLFFMADLPESILGEDLVCDDIKVRNKNIIYKIQGYELVPFTNPLQYNLKNPEDRAFCIFSFVWYFYTAQVQFGFIHRDFKVANCGFRAHDPANTMTFSLLGVEKHFVFENVTRIPVVFDLEFGASVGLTNPKDYEKNYGTPATMPPELINELNGMYMPQKVTQVFAYDWYSLGLTLVEILAYGVNLFFNKQFEGYLTSYLDRPELLGMPRYLITNVIRCAFLNYHLNHALVPEPGVYTNELYKILFGKTGGYILKELITKNQFLVEQGEKLLAALKPEERRVIGILLHWNPGRRDYFGSGHMLLTKHLLFAPFVREGRAAGHADYEFRAATFDTTRDTRQAQYGGVEELRCRVCSDVASMAIGERVYCRDERCARHEWFSRLA